jgi:uncharacterized protein (TIGR02757 family)
VEGKELKDFLDYKSDQYNEPGFIENDPVGIPHRYTLKEDIEISGLLVSVISWGNRKAIVKSGNHMMEFVGSSPYDFVMNHRPADLRQLNDFVHRTFNGQDFTHFIQALKNIYQKHGGPEKIFATYATNDSLQPAIHEFKKIFYSSRHVHRTTKHISDPLKGSSAKRINMYLRWMVRKDKKGVDFGIWKSVPQHILSCPLDIHSGNVARKLGLLNRTQNDAKALNMLDHNLRRMDKNDPAKYDFALFGLGMFEKFS